MLLEISLSAVAVTVFVFSCLLLAGILYFFGDTFTSMRRMKEQWENEKRLVSMPLPAAEEKKNSLFAGGLSKKSFSLKNINPKSHTLDDQSSLKDIRRSLLHQQQQLSLLLEKAEGRSGSSTGQHTETDKEKKLYEKIERLELLLEEKEEALQQGSQRHEVSDLLKARLEQAQREFESLQQRIVGLEKQAAAANELAMQLEDMKEDHKGLKKELSRKIEKLHELSTENGRLHKQLCDTEDKLQAANTHRHQLSKRVSLLEDLNTDFQDVSDTNSKLKNELRRISELESMLSMITQERNQLLGNK